MTKKAKLFITLSTLTLLLCACRGGRGKESSVPLPWNDTSNPTTISGTTGNGTTVTTTGSVPSVTSANGTTGTSANGTSSSSHQGTSVRFPQACTDGLFSPSPCETERTCIREALPPKAPPLPRHCQKPVWTNRSTPAHPMGLLS